MCSPAIKQWAEKQLSKGETHLVIDLENCTGMDSTFMGNMAGLAMKLVKVGGSLQVADASEKNQTSLEDLGLATLIDIEAKDASWQSEKSIIREKLQVVEAGSAMDKTAHVYETHKKLCEADTSNEKKFSTVLDCLEAELAGKKDQ